MNVTLNLITEFEDIPNEVSHMLRYVQDELAFTSRRTANVSAKLSQDDVDANEALELLLVGFQGNADNLQGLTCNLPFVYQSLPFVGVHCEEALMPR